METAGTIQAPITPSRVVWSLCVSTLINYLVFFGTYKFFGFFYSIASMAGYCAGVFLFCIIARFGRYYFLGQNKFFKFTICAVIFSTSLILSIAVLRAFVDLLNIRPEISNIFAIFFATLCNYLLCKQTIFNEKLRNQLEPWLYETQVRYYFSGYFYLGLFLKLSIAVLFASDYMTQWFIPFIQHYLDSGFSNPYEYFYKLGKYEIFPYSSLMLWIYSFPTAAVKIIFSNNIEKIPVISFLLARIPLLIADITIYISLCLLLPTRFRQVLWYYWFSPIIVYICYYHGQLDAIPTALFMLALVFLLGKKDILAYSVYGLALATKLHLAAAMPFLFLFTYFRKRRVLSSIALNCYAIVIYAVLQLPYITSEGFIKLVFQEEKKQRLFEIAYPFLGIDLQLLLAPAALLFIFFKYASMKSASKETLLLVLGLLFGAMVSVVPPMPGWFLWSFPFFVYFFAKYRDTPKLSFTIYSIAYIIYFLFEKNSDLFANMSHLSPVFEDIASPYQFALNKGINAALWQNILFTVLEVSLITNIFWIYRIGVSSTSLANKAKKTFTIGICGDSGAGKSRLAGTITKLFNQKNTLCIAGDDLHKWQRGDDNWQRMTPLNPLSNKLHQDVSQASILRKGQFIDRSFYDHSTGTFTSPVRLTTNKFIIFQGLHTFYIKDMRAHLNLKVFLDPDLNLRNYWKIKRDVAERGYSKEHVLEETERRKQDSAHYIEKQKQHANMVIRYELLEKGMSVEKLLEREHNPFKLHIIAENSFNLQLVAELLEENTELAINYYYDLEDDHVHLECTGDISDEMVKFLSLRLVVHYSEVLDDMPQWESGYDGILQLVILYYLFCYYQSN